MKEKKFVKLKDPKIKAKWSVALRSGRYSQGRGKLKKINSKGGVSHCCLGVLLEELSAEELGVVKKDWDRLTGELKGNFCFTIETKEDHTIYESNTLPETVVKTLFGTDMCMGHTLEESLPLGDLMSFNDSTESRKTFSQIADWIEENL